MLAKALPNREGGGVSEYCWCKSPLADASSLILFDQAIYNECIKKWRYNPKSDRISRLHKMQQIVCTWPSMQYVF